MIFLRVNGGNKLFDLMPISKNVDRGRDFRMARPIAQYSPSSRHSDLELEDGRAACISILPTVNGHGPSRTAQRHCVAVLLNFQYAHVAFDVGRNCTHNNSAAIPVHDTDYHLLRIVEVRRDIHGWHCVSQHEVSLPLLLVYLTNNEDDGPESCNRTEPATKCRNPLPKAVSFAIGASHLMESREVEDGENKEPADQNISDQPTRIAITNSHEAAPITLTRTKLSGKTGAWLDRRAA